MTNDELRALNKTRHIQQIAWLTRDLEKSMQAWIDTLRIGPWRVFRFNEKTVKNLKVEGKLVEGPFEFRIAITHVGDMEIELIQPVSGPMIYEDYIRRRGEGLHHIKEKVPDARMGQVLQDYAARDVKVTQTGQFAAKTVSIRDNANRTRPAEKGDHATSGVLKFGDGPACAYGASGPFGRF